MFEQQKSQLVYISYNKFIEYCQRNHLTPISALYGFWLLRYKHFYRNTPTNICDFSTIFIDFINSKTAEKSDCKCILFQGFRMLS